MARIGIAVHYKVKPGKREEVLAAIKGHAQRTKSNEPGCMQFDVLVPSDDDNDVRLFEMYADKDAFKAHTKAPYLAQIGEEMAPLLDDRIITVCEIVD